MRFKAILLAFLATLYSCYGSDECRERCSFPFSLDLDLCKCVPIGQPRCEKVCKEGYALDFKNCKCLVIKEEICRREQCKSPCHDGYKLDPHGCPTCDCLPPKDKERFHVEHCNKICPAKYELDLKICECLPIKKPVCLDIDKKCHEPCHYGYALDAHGCETCECLPFKGSKKFPDGQQCDKKCPIDYELDFKICECVFIKKPVCRFKECKTPCQYGYVVDSHGCETCECLPFRPKELLRHESSCNKKCPIDYQLDFKICECVLVKKPVCQFKECQKPCQYGYALDAHGCETCECLPFKPQEKFLIKPKCIKKCPIEYELDFKICECVPIKKPTPVCGFKKCKRPCQYGYVLDAHGCETCECLPPKLIKDNFPRKPRCEFKCPIQYEQDLKTCECVLIKKPLCQFKECKTPCQYGYVLDEHGCETCQCLPPKFREKFPVKPQCNKKCPVEYVLDLKICDCVLSKKPICRFQGCQKPCLFGYRLDSHGCETCKCLPSRLAKDKFPRIPLCEHRCPVEYAQDLKTCECVLIKKPACLLNKCKKPCQYGYVLDAHGCETCECLPFKDKKNVPLKPRCEHKCPVEYEQDLKTCECILIKKKVCGSKNCKKPCNFGYLLDGHGCETCECLPSKLIKDKFPQKPFCEFRCPIQYEQDLKTCECILIKKPVCRFKECKTPCQHGYVVDAHGCETCECLPPKLIKDNFPRKPFCEFKCPPDYKQDIKTCECILIKKPVCAFKECDRPCQYGYVIDAHGCETCECLPPKLIKDKFLQKPRCEFKCPIQYEQDLKKCECILIKKPVCRFKECKSPCQYGYVLDAHGCETCECLPPKVVKGNFPRKPRCEFKCPVDYKQDLKTCECVLIKKPLCRFKECKTPCQYGYILDQHGCETCECLPPKLIKDTFSRKPLCEFKCPIQYEQDLKTCECVLIKKPVCGLKECGRPCQYGYVLDSHGCETCECLPFNDKQRFPVEPFCNKKCPLGYELDLEVCDCIFIAKPGCGFKECNRPCHFGYALDSHGCQTCECLPNASVRSFDSREFEGEHPSFKQEQTFRFDGFEIRPARSPPTRFDRERQSFSSSRFDRQPQLFSPRGFDRRQQSIQPRKPIFRREQRDRRFLSFEQDRQRFERQHF